MSRSVFNIFAQNLTFHRQSCWSSPHFALVVHDTGPVSYQSLSCLFPHNTFSGIMVWVDSSLLHKWTVVQHPLHTDCVGWRSHITADWKVVIKYGNRWRDGHCKKYRRGLDYWHLFGGITTKSWPIQLLYPSLIKLNLWHWFNKFIWLQCRNWRGRFHWGCI